MYGFFRVAAAIPSVTLADPKSNSKEIQRLISIAANDYGADIVVFPELSLTGYSCADLFNQSLLLDAAEQELKNIERHCINLKIAAVVGCPLRFNDRLYNCAVFCLPTGIAAITAKTYLPNYNEFYEKRWFASGAEIPKDSIFKFSVRQESELHSENPLFFSTPSVRIGTNIIVSYKGVNIGAEICEDLWVPTPPSTAMAIEGADLIVNLSATDEVLGKHAYLMKLLSAHSAALRCAYAYSSAGWGESSTDLVFSGNAIIFEDGALLAESERFLMQPQIVAADIDIERLRNDRRRFSSFGDQRSPFLSCIHIPETKTGSDKILTPHAEKQQDNLLRRVDPTPFVPSDSGRLREHCSEIISIQSWGLARRIKAIGNGKLIIGISGGLDSTLALLVAANTCDLMGKSRQDIVGVTMPGFGTTTRTHSNATILMEKLGIDAREISIDKAVRQHFEDIGQNPQTHDATYENSQARERTQILMDLANKEGGIVVGTGDLSELALGWCTYNGDQMSMYGVNTSIPKTLVKYLVGWFASEAFDEETRKVLEDIIATPISPELIPAAGNADTIEQKTEDLVGPYELHDFFLFHTLRNSFGPEKILFLARNAFAEKYSAETLRHWLDNFYRRFFNQQFKRSCMPDGPKVGSVCLSPRGDWRMPSDASSILWRSLLK